MRTICILALLLGLVGVAQATYTVDVTVRAVHDLNVVESVVVTGVNQGATDSTKDTTKTAVSGHAYLTCIVDTLYTIRAEKLGYNFANTKVQMGAAFTDTVFLTIYIEGITLTLFENIGTGSGSPETYVGSVICSLFTTGGTFIASDVTQTTGRAWFAHAPAIPLAASTTYKVKLCGKSGYSTKNVYFATDANGWGQWAARYVADPSVTQDSLTGTVVYPDPTTGVSIPYAGTLVYFNYLGPSDSTGMPVSGTTSATVATDGTFTLWAYPGSIGNITVCGKTWKSAYTVSASGALGTFKCQ